ncbi:hypothetical protein PENTCL1PPCAC_18443, partial [Pristionchus entomophagus]
LVHYPTNDDMKLLHGVTYQILLSTAIPLVFLLPPVNWQRRLSVFNTKTEDNTALFQIMVWFEIIPGILSLVIFHSALYLNHRRDPEKIWIGGCWSEIDSQNCGHSSAWTHFIFNAITSFALQLYPIFDPHPSLVSQSIALECCNIIQLYPAALVLILLYKVYCRGVREVEYRFQLLLRPLQLPRGQISTILDLNKEQSKTAHFEQLRIFRGYFDDGQDYGKPRWYNGICC